MNCVSEYPWDRFRSDLSGMKGKGKQNTHFAVCINNLGYEASLEVGKLYRVVPDEEAASRSYIRVIDESGEDYGYSASRFFPIEVPLALQRALKLPTAHKLVTRRPTRVS